MESPSPETPKVEYNENNSVLFSDLIVALKRTDIGPAILLAPVSRTEMTQALGEIQVALTRECIHMDMMAQAKRKIIEPKGGFLNGIRNRIK
jgi:hypothetical protein